MFAESDRKRKLESVARILIGATTDGEFDNALRRARELSEKTGVSLREIMLSNLNISVNINKKNEIYDLEDKIEDLKRESKIFRDENKKIRAENAKLHDHIRKYTRTISKLKDELQPKKERKEKLEGYRELYLKLMHTNDRMQTRIDDLHKEIAQLKKQLSQTNENKPIIAKNIVSHFAKKYKFQCDKKSWISTKTLYKKAELYFDDYQMSVKRFSLEFGKALGIISVVGGKKQNNKGFNVRCPVIPSEG
ncbi:MAG: hypothetical protein V4591_10210 [Bdellovibrionota bacterium]